MKGVVISFILLVIISLFSRAPLSTFLVFGFLIGFVAFLNRLFKEMYLNEKRKNDC